ncbi:MAG: hypothetical protein ACLU4N_09840 [Butyricimonas faecihominis]
MSNSVKSVSFQSYVSADTSTLIGNREPLWVVDGIVVQDPVPISPEELNDRTTSTVSGMPSRGLTHKILSV